MRHFRETFEKSTLSELSMYFAVAQEKHSYHILNSSWFALVCSVLPRFPRQLKMIVQIQITKQEHTIHNNACLQKFFYTAPLQVCFYPFLKIIHQLIIFSAILTGSSHINNLERRYSFLHSANIKFQNCFLQSHKVHRCPHKS